MRYPGSNNEKILSSVMTRAQLDKICLFVHKNLRNSKIVIQNTSTSSRFELCNVVLDQEAANRVAQEEPSRFRSSPSP
jgi:hypothetical protein